MASAGALFLSLSVANWAHGRRPKGVKASVSLSLHSRPRHLRGLFLRYAQTMDPLHATIEEFAAEGYTHVECFCPRCRVIRLRPMSWLPKISMGLTIAQLSERLRCAECGRPLQSVKPWRLADVLGKPEGRRGALGVLRVRRCRRARLRCTRRHMRAALIKNRHPTHQNHGHNGPN